MLLNIVQALIRVLAKAETVLLPPSGEIERVQHKQAHGMAMLEAAKELRERYSGE